MLWIEKSQKPFNKLLYLNGRWHFIFKKRGFESFLCLFYINFLKATFHMHEFQVEIESMKL